MKIPGLFALLLVFLSLGCAGVKGYLEIFQERGLSKDYFDVLARSTRSETLYSQLETRVRIKATHKSPEFNRAYLEEYTRIYRQVTPENLLPAAKTGAGEFLEFYFYAYLPDREANDFARPRSIWAVFLLDEKGRRIDPVDLRRIDKVTPVVEAFFPYVNRHYGYFYLVRFPAPADGDPASRAGGETRLVFASVLGRVALSWN